MKEYKLDINPRAFNAIKNKTKKIEIRASTDINIDYSEFKENDRILFSNDDTQENLKCKVKRVTWYCGIRELLEKEGTEYTLSSTNDIEKGIESIYTFKNYKETIEAKGVYAIEVEVIE